MAKHKRTALAEFIDQDVIDDYLDNSDDALQAKLELGGEAVDYAKSIAPEDSGDYKDGIRLRRRGKTGVSLEFSDSESNIIEDGSVDTPAFHVRSRTIAHFGGDGGDR
jgi:hypothetical protein